MATTSVIRLLASISGYPRGTLLTDYPKAKELVKSGLAESVKLSEPPQPNDQTGQEKKEV